MSLTADGLKLVSGDSKGSIYVWNLTIEGENSQNMLKMFNIHED